MATWTSFWCELWSVALFLWSNNTDIYESGNYHLVLNPDGVAADCGQQLQRPVYDWP